MTTKTCGATYLTTRLQKLSVNHLFPVPGDYTSDFPEIVDTQNSIKRIGNCNELNAGYAADGYVRANGLGAVALTTGVGSFSLLKASKNKIERTMSELKAAQSLLIQAEKMASPGEFSDCIAHEIQNPLNFDNNFSEVSGELIGEMNAELENGDINEAKEIGKDLEQNLEKINHRGKRADAIVKGMLLHSRGSSGKKEPTDINALADEYLRLSYHGFRAKDKSFNAEFKLELDENLPKMEVVPQDIGRVLRNLINNAFHAVSEKSKLQAPGFKPQVVVSTKLERSPLGGPGGQAIVISVHDNDPGIPENIRDKIFQPFFTSKPTGQGTGLGLSLSYDIVKAHGREISVKSNKSEGTAFTIMI